MVKICQEEKYELMSTIIKWLSTVDRGRDRGKVVVTSCSCRIEGLVVSYEL